MESDTYVPIHNYVNLTPGRQDSIDDSESIFSDKGPLLSTTTFKTELYKNNPFNIDEHCFYVDMEYNFFIYQRAKNVTYLPLDL